MSKDRVEKALPLAALALPLCIAIAVWGIAAPESLTSIADGFIAAAFRRLDSTILFTISAFVVLLLALAISPVGRLRLGRPDERPEFSVWSWLAMLFAAGMGIGLVFWGVAEPMSHLAAPIDAAPFSREAARRAMVLTSFHWGLHAWAVYGVAALVLAYFGFRRGTRALPGAPLRFAFSGRWTRPAASVADLLSVVAVAFGVAGSIAMGVLQMHSGLHVTVGVPQQSTLVPVLILVAMVIAYQASAVTRLDKGIKWLSNINMVLALALMLFVLFAGPTERLLAGFIEALSDYATGLPALPGDVLAADPAWLKSWSLTYLVWWVAWAPFVGIFIARISRGRTIREFVVGVLLVPTVFSVLWFAILGGTGFHEQLQGAGRDRRARRQGRLGGAVFALRSTPGHDGPQHRRAVAGLHLSGHQRRQRDLRPGNALERRQARSIGPDQARLGPVHRHARGGAGVDQQRRHRALGNDRGRAPLRRRPPSAGRRPTARAGQRSRAARPRSFEATERRFSTPSVIAPSVRIPSKSPKKLISGGVITVSPARPMRVLTSAWLRPVASIVVVEIPTAASASAKRWSIARRAAVPRAAKMNGPMPAPPARWLIGEASAQTLGSVPKAFS